MKVNLKKNIFLIFGCILGILIILIPAFLTGSLFLMSSYSNGLDIADHTMKVIAPMVGLLVIYDSIKTYIK